MFTLRHKADKVNVINITHSISSCAKYLVPAAHGCSLAAWDRWAGKAASCSSGHLGKEAVGVLNAVKEGCRRAAERDTVVRDVLSQVRCGLKGQREKYVGVRDAQVCQF